MFITRRPLLLISIFFTTGIILSNYISSYQLVSILILIGAIFLFILIIQKSMFKKEHKEIILNINEIKNKKSELFIIIFCVLFIFVGFARFAYVRNTLENKYHKFYEKEVTISGVIEEVPRDTQRRREYTVKTKTVKVENNIYKVVGKLIVSIPQNDSITFEYGDEIVTKGILIEPSGRRNIGGFDYRRYLAQRGISGVIYSNIDDVKLIQKGQGNIIKEASYKIKNRIINIINESLPIQQAGLLNGIIIGHREGVEREVADTFSDAGLTHIMAVSGAHVGFLILALVLLFRFLSIRRGLGNILIIIILFIYAFITGFQASVLRASIMASIFLIGEILKREPDSITSVALAGLILLISNPFSLFSVGFQLSFVATISLILFYTKIREFIMNFGVHQYIAGIISVTISAQIGVLPLLSYHFNKISTISILSNIIVVPIVGIVTILGFIMSLVGQFGVVFSTILGYINVHFLTFILLVTKYTSQIPFATLRIITPSIAAILLYYLVVIYLIRIRGQINKKISKTSYLIISTIIGIIVIINLLIPKPLEVVFLDVGSGDAIFIRTSKGKTALIDGGGYRDYRNRYFSMGDDVVIPFFLRHGVRGVDLIISTHSHQDHLAGLISVIRDYKVDAVIIPHTASEDEYKEFIELAKDRNVSLKHGEAGDVIIFDKKTHATILSPDRNFTTSRAVENNYSIVLKLEYKNVSFLFTGDIEEEAELYLYNQNIDLKADVLKIAHHGSRSSTTEEFLIATEPKIAVISVGRNPFGHPSKEVLDRLCEYGVITYRTDNQGSVIMRTDGNRIKVNTMLNN